MNALNALTRFFEPKQASNRSPKIRLLSLVYLFAILALTGVSAQNMTIPTGSYIINMGVTPQTTNNALRPYGMLYDLIKNNGVTVYWYINPSKGKDGIDFTHNGTQYKGGTFIILQQHRSSAVNSRITHWTGQGVIGATTVSSFTLALVDIIPLSVAPRWTMDQKNGDVAEPYFQLASIPASAHGGSNSSNWKLPSQLDCCDDLFVMPHADPIWSTHQRLVSWNLECNGGIFVGCRAGSSLANMVNPSDRTQQANFLAVKDPNFQGTTGNYSISSAQILSDLHSDGTPPYSNRLFSDPVAQFMGIQDGAFQNGNEQIYIPRQGIVTNPSTYNANAIARWNPNARVITYDPTHPNVTNPDTITFKNVAALTIYGRGFDDPNRGWVLMQAGHRLNKDNTPQNVAAIRSFFNWSFLASNDLAPITDISGIPGVFGSGQATSISISVTGGSSPYTVSWSSSCGGSFSPNNSSSFSTTFTAPVVNSNTPCNIHVMVVDNCGRQTNSTAFVEIQKCDLVITRTVTNVACNGQSTGSINMTISGSPGPFNWNWTRVSPAGSGSGTGLVIGGLSAGTYNVTVTDGGACTGTFSQLVTQPATLSATPTVTNYQCFGQTGAINLAVTGGTQNYAFSWTGPGGFTSSSKDISNLQAGTYNVTVTDAKNCTASATATVNGPASGIAITLESKQNASCNGANNGEIDISVTGGTPGYTYLWNDGPTTQDRTGLAPGTYTVTVTDANSCTATLTEVIEAPTSLVLTVTKENPTCPPGGGPPLNGDGSIDLTVTGGTAPYTYDWADLTPPPAEPQDRTNLSEGTYSVTVTDDQGCTASISVVLTAEIPLPSPPLQIND